MSPRWRFYILTLAALLGVLGTLALGRWQLSRAAQKEAIQAGIDRQATLPSLNNPALLAWPEPAAALHRRVILRGHWLTAHSVFLDNRPMSGKVGLYVVTPLQLENSSVVVLVQRGWVARNFVDRTQLPVVQTPSGIVTIEGRIAPAPAKLYAFDGPDQGLIRQNLDLSRYSTELGQPLWAVSVQQTGAANEGLLRQWPLVSTGVEKHYGYAFQWFALSALIALLYVWFQIVRRFIPARRA